MADNINDNALDNPTNAQSRNLSNDITPTNDTETISQNQETKNMEVHKHPHHVTHKKKWGEYLLEFFMRFLAVFLGFIAENVREHQVEREREKELAVSFYNELKSDSAAFQIAIDNRERKDAAFNYVKR